MTKFNQTVKGLMGRCNWCTKHWSRCVPEDCFSVKELPFCVECAIMDVPLNKKKLCESCAIQQEKEMVEMQKEFAEWDDARLEKEEEK